MKRLKDARTGPPRQLVPPELVERCRRGDEQAWNELVETTYRDVYTLCLRILRDPEDASEATQDAYLKVWRGLKGFRGDAMLETWMYRVATNTAISKHRSRKRKQAHEAGVGDELLSEMAASGSVEATAGAKIEVEAVDKALASLPEHYRAAVVLRDVYGFSTQEVAKQLKISETAAKVRVHRGRKKLREIVWGPES